MVHEQLNIKEKAQTRGKRTDGHRRVHQTEQEKKVEKVEKIPDTPVAKPLHSSNPRHPVARSARDPQRITMQDSPPVKPQRHPTLFTTPTGHLVPKMPCGKQQQIDLMPTLIRVVKAKVGEEDKVGDKEGMGTPRLSAVQSPKRLPLSSPPSRHCQQPPFPISNPGSCVLPANWQNSHMNTII